MRVNRPEREAGHLPSFIAGISEARAVKSTFSYSWLECKTQEQICILHSSLFWLLSLAMILSVVMKLPIT